METDKNLNGPISKKGGDGSKHAPSLPTCATHPSSPQVKIGPCSKAISTCLYKERCPLKACTLMQGNTE